MIKKITIFLAFLSATSVFGQSVGVRSLTLEQAIEIAHERSPKALIAQLSYMSKYWKYRSYKAQFLPSLNLNAGIGEYNRSLVEVRDPKTGEISYVANNSLSNDVSISIDQNIALTGGKISVDTELARLDQFDYDNKIYSTNPLTIKYRQPIRGFNSLKWEKETSPREYENSKRQYLESMETITINTTTQFFAVLSAQTDYQKAVDNYNDTKRLYEIAKKRFDIATVSKSELLQLELSMINAEMAINSNQIALDIARFNFCIYLGIAERETVDIDLIAPSEIPEIMLSFDKVLDRAYNNSTHKIAQELALINAKRDVAQAKANRGIQVDLNANLGLSQSASELQAAYTNLKDREIFGITLSMPIYDWGMSRGKVRMAEAEERLAMTEVEQAELEFIQDIKIKVLQFNNQKIQCENSAKAKAIASERYEITTKRFENGTITVTDLKTAQEEKDNANNSYIKQLRTFWNSYYEIQKLSLYDYRKNVDISTEFDKLIENN